MGLLKGNLFITAVWVELKSQPNSETTSLYRLIDCCLAGSKTSQYGTQYVGNPDTAIGGSVLDNFDAQAVSDDERVQCGIKKAADISKVYAK